MISSSAIVAGAAFVKISLDSAELTSGLKKSHDSVKRFSGSLREFGEKMSLFASAIQYPFAEAVKAFANFDMKMRQMQSITSSSAVVTKELSNYIRSLARNSSFTTSQVQDAAITLARLGFNADEVSNSLKSVMDLSIASGEELNSSAKIAGTMMRIFSIEASRMSKIADVISMTVNRSSQSMQDYAEAASYAGPAFANVGQSIEEMSASIGILSNMGIRGSMAGNALSRAFRRFADSNVSETLKGYGVSAFDSNGKMRPLVNTLRDLFYVVREMDDRTRINFLQDLFEVRGAIAGLPLTANVSNIEALMEVLERSSGYADNASKNIEGGIKKVLSNLRSAWEDFVIEVGNSSSVVFKPWIVSATEFIKTLQSITPAAMNGMKYVMHLGSSFILFGVVVSVFSKIKDAIMMLISPMKAFNDLLLGAKSNSERLAEAERAMEISRTASENDRIANEKKRNAMILKSQMESMKQSADKNSSKIYAISSNVNQQKEEIRLRKEKILVIENEIAKERLSSDRAIQLQNEKNMQLKEEIALLRKKRAETLDSNIKSKASKISKIDNAIMSKTNEIKTNDSALSQSRFSYRQKINDYNNEIVNQKKLIAMSEKKIYMLDAEIAKESALHRESNSAYIRKKNEYDEAMKSYSDASQSAIAYRKMNMPESERYRIRFSGIDNASRNAEEKKVEASNAKEILLNERKNLAKAKSDVEYYMKKKALEEASLKDFEKKVQMEIGVQLQQRKRGAEIHSMSLAMLNGKANKLSLNPGSRMARKYAEKYEKASGAEFVANRKIAESEYNLSVLRERLTDRRNALRATTDSLAEANNRLALSQKNVNMYMREALSANVNSVIASRRNNYIQDADRTLGQRYAETLIKKNPSGRNFLSAGFSFNNAERILKITDKDIQLASKHLNLTDAQTSALYNYYDASQAAARGVGMLSKAIAFLKNNWIMIAIFAVPYILRKIRQSFESAADAARRYVDAASMKRDNFKKDSDDQIDRMKKRRSDLEYLINLSRQQSLTSVQSQNAADIVRDLSSAYGDLGVMIDSATGKIIVHSNALRKLDEENRNRRLRNLEEEKRLNLNAVSYGQNDILQDLKKQRGFPLYSYGRNSLFNKEKYDTVLSKAGFTFDKKAFDKTYTREAVGMVVREKWGDPFDFVKNDIDVANASIDEITQKIKKVIESIEYATKEGVDTSALERYMGNLVKLRESMESISGISRGNENKGTSDYIGGSYPMPSDDSQKTYEEINGILDKYEDKDRTQYERDVKAIEDDRKKASEYYQSLMKSYENEKMSIESSISQKTKRNLYLISKNREIEEEIRKLNIALQSASDEERNKISSEILRKQKAIDENRKEMSSLSEDITRKRKIELPGVNAKMRDLDDTYEFLSKKLGYAMADVKNERYSKFDAEQLDAIDFVKSLKNERIRNAKNDMEKRREDSIESKGGVNAIISYLKKKTASLFAKMKIAEDEYMSFIEHKIFEEKYKNLSDEDKKKNEDEANRLKDELRIVSDEFASSRSEMDRRIYEAKKAQDEASKNSQLRTTGSFSVKTLNEMMVASYELRIVNATERSEKHLQKILKNGTFGSVKYAT